jgi:hypothetical protein
MAQLRLMLVALAACSASDAAPGAGSALPPGVNAPFAPPRAQIATPPAGWLPMPQLATAATSALTGENKATNALTAATADAWGEPAMGCYAVAVTFAARGTADAVGKQLLADVQKAVAVRDVVVPTGAKDTGVLAFAFDKAPYSGRARVLIGGGVTALACFWNPREPLACEAACTALIGSMK